MNRNIASVVRWASLAVSGAFIAACGGGGGGSGSGSGSGVDIEEPTWVQGQFELNDDYYAQCVTPRSGTDSRGRTFVDEEGSALHEKLWLRAWSNEFYLWYDEIADVNPGPFTIPAYFDVLKTTALTDSLRPKDNYHFSASTAEFQREQQSGIRLGYGMTLSIKRTTPREVTVAFTNPNTPATNVSLSRGAKILSVNGTDITTNTESGLAVLNAGIFPSSEDVRENTFEIQDLGSSTIRTITMTPEEVVTTPVQHVQTYDTPAGRVGYFLFLDHIAPAEIGLINAVNQLADADIDELVLDLRYNGGGLLSIASQLSYMIAGSTATNDKTFELLTFNDKHPTRNPFTNELLEAEPFESRTLGFSVNRGQALPTLNLQRVFVITTPGTCSASESIINGLRGIDVEVIQIGTTTCGKPYGFYPADNCGTTYFSVQFQGANDKGFGDYPDGFSPMNSSDLIGVAIPGCETLDDLNHALGDEDELNLAAALHYMENGSCPTVAVSASNSALQKPQGEAVQTELLGVPEWRKARIMGLDE